jgi:histidine triad (HIT) family protein
MKCVFCSVLAGELTGTFVYRGDLVSAFMDIQPVNPGHLLVVPNQHAALMSDLSAETANEVFQVARKLAAALRASGLRCEGVNLFVADGEAAMQEVPHFHLHVFPRFVGDGFGLKFPDHYFRKPERSEVESCAQRIRNALNG